MKYFIVLACAVLCTVAVPLPEVDQTNVEFVIQGAETPAEVAESIRRARQVFEDINIDIVEGGGNGGYGGFGSQGGYNGGLQQGGYGGFQQGGYGGYGGNQGYQETNVDIIQDNFGK